MSPTSLTDRLTGISKLLAAAVAVLLVGALLLAVTGRDGKSYVTVDFPQTNSLYEGSDVKILGVAVGQVETLTPRGDVVRAKLSYEEGVSLPADVKAVIVSPAIVGDRFVQFAPAYGGGAALENNAFLPVDRTAVPVELDAIYKSLNDLSVALGPEGANKEGALSRLLDNTAEQLDGQGAQLNTTLTNFGKLSTTLANNKEELFGSLREVRDFVELLNRNDDAVRAFNDSTARVSTVLEGERQDLEATLRELSLALVDVNKLVKDNQGTLRENVTNLRELSQVLANRTAQIEEATIAAPTALANVALAYNPKFGTLDVRASLDQVIGDLLGNPVQFLCGLLGQQPGENGLCDGLNDLIEELGLSDIIGNLLDGLGGAVNSPAATPEGVAEQFEEVLQRVAPSESVSNQPQASVAEMLAVKR